MCIRDMANALLSHAENPQLGKKDASVDGNIVITLAKIIGITPD